MNLGILKTVLSNTWELTKYTDPLSVTGRKCPICMNSYSELGTKDAVSPHLVGTDATVPVVLRRGQRARDAG